MQIGKLANKYVIRIAYKIFQIYLIKVYFEC